MENAETPLPMFKLRYNTRTTPFLHHGRDFFVSEIENKHKKLVHPQIYLKTSLPLKLS